ncbi:MAG: hypothetical protein M1820_009280 [Bogoriella megaspora]|nr:MAG: hypothetical protein M1820_009280 [Bogoriella megaspora]
MSCLTCHSIAIPEPNGNFSKDIDAKTLEKSAQEGCEICLILKEAISSYLNLDKVETAKMSIISEYNRETDRREPLVIKAPRPIEKEFEIYTTNVNTAKACPALAVRGNISIDSSSAESMQLAKTWLDQCIEQHANKICPSGSKRLLPKRLIVVGDGAKKPWLYESTSNETGTYATLSYSWGGPSKFTTTLKNFDERKAGFELSDCPKTIREAIIITRALSINFLWIDALCIIQDSGPDWEVESSKMCSVYENSLVTIAATDSSSIDAGIFCSSFARTSTEVACNIGVRGTIFTRLARSRFGRAGSVHTASGPNGFLGRTPKLSTRGWTLQELKLSPRLLLFSKNELGWMCQDSGACECDPDFRKLNPASGEMGQFATVEQADHARFAVSSGLNNSIVSWIDTVQAYSTRQLSESADKLPALSGLADKYGQILYGHYICGVWETSQLEVTA